MSLLEQPIITSNERTIYQEYVLDRRRRLTAVIAPLIAVLATGSALFLGGFIFLLGTVAHQAVPSAAIVLDATVAMLAGALTYGTVALRRGRVNLAAGLTASSIALTIVIFHVLWTLNQGLDPYSLILFTALDFVVVLIGALGDIRTIVTITALVSVEAALLWTFGPRSPTMATIVNRELILIGPGSIFVLWGLAGLQIAVQRTTRTTLAELGSVRVAYERAQRLDELKDQFISSVNHELRTPLSAMLGFLEILDLSVERATPARLRTIIADANEAGEDLNHLVSSILETRRLDQSAANFTPERVVVQTVLTKAIRLIDPREGRMVERELWLNIPPDFAIWGEPIRLQQILLNLLSNAIKYSEPGTRVEVTASVIAAPQSSAQRGRKATPVRQMAEIVVRDYGLGVPADEVELLFQRFVRLPRDLASRTQGNGLGLYLCRVFAEALGGRIWVASSGIEGEGSAFHLVLPLAPETADT